MYKIRLEEEDFNLLKDILKNELYKSEPVDDSQEEYFNKVMALYDKVSTSKEDYGLINVDNINDEHLDDLRRKLKEVKEV